MNNKDLFNAINDIDEQFVADAGKYLSDEDSDDPSHSEAIEIFPGESRFSPIKLVASLVAAAVLITGVTIAVKHHRRGLSVSPNTTSEDGNASASDLDAGTNSGNSIDPQALISDGTLPFEVMGPDNRRIWYGEVTDFSGAGNIEELTEENWESIVCDGFAYVASPLGYNFNNVDNSPEDLDTLSNNKALAHEFNRVYVGSKFGSLTVSKASSTFTPVSTEKIDGRETSTISALAKNYVEFNGEITASVYIVNDDADDRYYFFFRNGEDQFPLVNYNPEDPSENNTYTTDLNSRACLNGFRYEGELPALILGEKEREIIEPYLSNANYLQAHLTISNIKMESGQIPNGKREYEIECDTSRAVFNYVESVVTDNNPFGETPFTGEAEREIRSILGSARDISELKNDPILKKLTNYTDIRVYIDTNKDGDDFLGEVTEGDLNPGNYIALYLEDELIAAYRYHEADLQSADFE